MVHELLPWVNQVWVLFCFLACSLFIDSYPSRLKMVTFQHGSTRHAKVSVTIIGDYTYRLDFFFIELCKAQASFVVKVRSRPRTACLAFCHPSSNKNGIKEQGQ